jgi:hypothetical protein
VALQCESGQPIMPGDQVRYDGELGQIEFVVEQTSSVLETAWYLRTLGPGVMIAEPKVFGHVYVTEFDERLAFVARQGASNGTR